MEFALDPGPLSAPASSVPSCKAAGARACPSPCLRYFERADLPVKSKGSNGRTLAQLSEDFVRIAPYKQAASSLKKQT